MNRDRWILEHPELDIQCTFPLCGRTIDRDREIVVSQLCADAVYCCKECRRRDASENNHRSLALLLKYRREELAKKKSVNPLTHRPKSKRHVPAPPNPGQQGGRGRREAKADTPASCRLAARPPQHCPSSRPTLVEGNSPMPTNPAAPPGKHVSDVAARRAGLEAGRAGGSDYDCEEVLRGLCGKVRPGRFVCLDPFQHTHTYTYTMHRRRRTHTNPNGRTQKHTDTQTHKKQKHTSTQSRIRLHRQNSTSKHTKFHSVTKACT